MSIFDKAGQCGAVECTEEDFDYALGVLPPAAYFTNGFAMGEPAFGDPPWWYCFWQIDGKFWCLLATLEEAQSVSNIDENGVTYSREGFPVKKPLVLTCWGEA